MDCTALDGSGLDLYTNWTVTGLVWTGLNYARLSCSKFDWTGKVELDGSEPDWAMYCVVFIHFYSASHSMSLSEVLPTTEIDTVLEITSRSATANCK